MLRSTQVSPRRSQKASKAARVAAAPSAVPGSGHTVIAAALIVLAGLTAYQNSFAGVFVFDDEPAIALNENLRSLSPLSSTLTAPPDTTLSGRPVATFSFAIDTALRGGSLVAYHQTNLAIHLGAALLLFGVVRRTLSIERLQPAFGESATALALSIALVFVVHPLQTASVTYIVQRVESLMGFLYLATLYAAIRASSARSRAALAWSAAAVALCALGMGTKESMATAPLAVVLWDGFFLETRPRARRVLHAALVLTWSVLLSLVAASPRGLSVGFGFTEWPWWRYLMTQAGVIAHYMKLVILPWPLVLDYEWPAASAQEAALPGFFIIGALAWTVRLCWNRKPVGFLLAWIFLTLAPTSSVLPIVTEIAAEHRMYLPLAGVVSLVVLGTFRFWRRLRGRGPERLAAGLPLFGWAAFALIVGGLGLLTRERNADYADYDHIWAKTVVDRPDNARARTNLASSYLTQGRYADAEQHLLVAVQRAPDSVEVQANLGLAYAAQGRLDEGIPHLFRAVALKPAYVSARRNLAEALVMRRRFQDALAQYDAGLAIVPDDVSLMTRTAWLLAACPDPSIRNGARARDIAERAVQRTGRKSFEALDTLAVALADVGDFDRAVTTAREAFDRANEAGRSDIAAAIDARAAQFARRQPFREP